MSNIKIVLTDLDGTVVLPSQYDVANAVKEKIVELEKNGVPVIPVTGRPYEMAIPVMLALGCDGLCVVDGGASIRNIQTGEIIWSKWLEPLVIIEIVEVLSRYAVQFMEYGPIQNPIEITDVDTSAITQSAPFAFGPIPNDKVKKVEAELANIPGVVAHSNPNWAGNNELTGMQVTHKFADKSHGVKQLLKIMEIPKDYVLAIGDSNNDLPLFKHCELKIAMGNATESLKAEADHVVGAVEDNGFVDAMNRFVLS